MFKRTYWVHKHSARQYRIKTTVFGLDWSYVKDPRYYSSELEFSNEADAETWIKNEIASRVKSREGKKKFRG